VKLPNSLTRHDPQVRRAQTKVNSLELEISQLCHGFSLPEETMNRAKRVDQLRRELVIARQDLDFARRRASDRIIMMRGGQLRQ
jgi:hypothetical protein